MAVTLEDIRAAAELMAGDVVRTPTVAAPSLSADLGADVYIKLETLQRTGSFKDRGSLVKLKSLSSAEAERGVIAVSAGNHAQGVAAHAQRLGIPATILMPEGTPFNKIRRTEAYGAAVVLRGETLNEAEPHAHELAAEHGYTFVHPYDDERIIAGQGTVALEMLADVPELDAIVVPIGGGGIISGIAIAAKAMNPRIEVIGVESEIYPSMYNAIHGIDGSLGGDTLADGIAVKSPGALTRPIIEALVDGIAVVAEASIEAAVQTLLIDAKLLVEGAGATPLAAVMEQRDRFRGRRVGLVACGANIDPRILSSILMRGMSRAGHLASLQVSITDQTGTLARVAKVIGDAGGNIVEIHHQRMFSRIPVKRAELNALVETRDASHADTIIARLEEAGFPTRRRSERAEDD